MSEFTAELDAKGMACPLPILKAKKAISGLSAGEIIKITATDPGSVKAFASQTENGGTYTFFIKVLT